MGSQKSKLSPVALKDIADNTDFTEREIQIWFKSFSKDCPSGKLSFDGFKKIYRDFYPDGDASAFAQCVFKTFDNNHDGTIDFREFVTALSMMSRGSFKDKLAWSFNMYDQDKDGSITKNEMLNIISAMYKMLGEKATEEVLTDGLSAEERTDRIFEQMDKDGDQKISLEEFEKAAFEDPSLMQLMQIGQS